MRLNIIDVKEIAYYAEKGENYTPETNEDLVELIQITDKEIYWSKLKDATKMLMHFVFQKINSYYKKNMKDDMYSILRMGWVKAVKNYNRSKCDKFHAFASYLMYQQFVMFARRITKDKEGVSVRYQLFNNAHSSENNNESEKDKEGCVASIMSDDSFEKTIQRFELKEFLMEKLKKLTEIDKLSAELIYKHYYCNITQKALCEEYNLNQSTISRKIKAGFKFLKTIINRNEISIA